MLVGIGVPAAVVRDPIAARDDEQLLHRGLLEPLRHPAASEPSGFLGPRLPIAFDGRAGQLAPAEVLGASTDAVLSDWLGLDAPELERLRAAGAISGPPPAAP
jgi:crotonobetainyl-CoA:carnitine CoA-transferase CaiB-like acyl-CoA transferase